MRFKNGLTVFNRDSAGGLCLASMHPPASSTWHWHISICRYLPGERRYFLKWAPHDIWTRANQWHDDFHFLWCLRVRFGHQLYHDQRYQS
jgi:hypothetical protein